MSLTKAEHGVKREILVKFSQRVGGFKKGIRHLSPTPSGVAPAERVTEGSAACPICFPGAFAVDLVHAPRAVVCAGHYWHPVARLFRVASSLFLPSSGRCLTQKPGGRDPRGMTNDEFRMTNLGKGERRS